MIPACIDVGASGTGGECVAGMTELIYYLRAGLLELAAIETESIGWLPLGGSAYLNVVKPDEEEVVITLVGVPDVSMAGMYVL